MKRSSSVQFRGISCFSYDTRILVSQQSDMKYLLHIHTGVARVTLMVTMMEEDPREYSG